MLLEISFFVVHTCTTQNDVKKLKESQEKTNEDIVKLKEAQLKGKEDLQQLLKTSHAAVLSMVQGLRTIDRLFYGGTALFFTTAVFTFYWMHGHEVKLQDLLLRFERRVTSKLNIASTEAKVADAKANLLSENFSGLLSNGGVGVEK